MAISIQFASSLERSINQFLNEDLLDNSDSYKCENCRQVSKAKIKHELSCLPRVLIFHLKRFQAYPKMKKIEGKCSYPMQLDMSE
jgi:ubiquitin C-terminal hydrolase